VRDLPVGKPERLGVGKFFSVEWRHGMKSNPAQ